MLLLHPRIYLDASGTFTDALLIRDALVLATGEQARLAATSDDPIVQPDAACVFPALGDAHIHLWGLGLRAGAVDLRGMNVDAILSALKNASPHPNASKHQQDWIFGVNWDEHNFDPNENLSLATLDHLFPSHPLCLRRVDGHALWVNSRALQRAKIPEHVLADHQAGLAERDHCGRLTGKLIDRAMEPVLQAIPEPTEQDDQAVLLETIQKLRHCGIAFCTLAWCPIDRIPMLQSLLASGELGIHLDVLVDGEDDDLELLPEYCTNPTISAFHPHQSLRIRGVKFFADGALGSAGAHLLSPYRTGGTGLRIHPEEFLTKRIPQLMQNDWQVAVHAIGDAAAREVLDAFASVPAPLRRRLRPRLEHAQVVDPLDAPRFAQLDVIASIQPIHLRSDAPWLRRRLFDHQLPHLFPWRSLLPATLAAGSDFPIDDINPWHGISTALSRKGSDDIPFQPQHALTATEILTAYTHGAAFASHRENFLGQLHPGSLAELIFLDHDPFRASPHQLWNTAAQSFSHCPSSAPTR